MPNNHRVVVNPASLPFDTYPIKLETATPFVVSYEVVSTGGAMRSSGKRIYDTSILPSSGAVTVQPGSPLLFPFITTQLPTTYFDAVFLLTIDGNRYIQGFSNSPDNVAAYTSNYFLEDKKMFGLFLKCFAVGGSLGNFDTNNHYMFGGEPSGFSTFSNSMKMVFDAPTPTPVTMTRNITFYGTTILRPTYTFPPVIVPTGSIEFNFDPFNLFVTGDNINLTGYYRIEIIPSDSSYVSILPFYHWGQYS